MSFRGNQEYQLDKNRVPIPPRYRELFAAGAIMTPGLERCVQVWTPEGYEEQASVLDDVAFESEEGRKARRAFFGNAFDAQRDAQGRLPIDKKLVAYAGLVKDVVVVGTDRCLEIWDKAEWDAQQDDLMTTRLVVVTEIGRRKNAERAGTEA